MKRLYLERDAPVDSGRATVGTLIFDGLALKTIERLWFPTAPGGQPFASCVPAGRYELVPFIRPNGDHVRALVNPGFGVYLEDTDRPNGVGRYLILIHAGKWVDDVVGCIAPGTTLAETGKGPMVQQSRQAMQSIMGWLGDAPAEIIIRWRGEWR